jgi:hypothetical protein
MIFHRRAETCGSGLSSEIGFKIYKVAIEETYVITSYNTKFYTAFGAIFIFSSIEGIVEGTSTLKELLFVSTCVIS